MPAKPTWLHRLPEILRELEALPDQLDRATIQELLGVERRRAQQIMAPCAAVTIGSSMLVDKEALIDHLQHLAGGEAGEYEARRRARLAAFLERENRQRMERPRELPVAAPIQVVNQEFESLPAGVELAPGVITVRFSQPQEALEKLLALAMAVSNDFERFERLTMP